MIEPPLPPLEEREGMIRAGDEVVVGGVEEVREVIEKREDAPDGIELV